MRAFTNELLPHSAHALEGSLWPWEASADAGEDICAHSGVDVKMTFVLGARKRLDDEQEKSGLGRTDEE